MKSNNKQQNSKHRMNPARVALLAALENHGGGYSTDSGRTSSCLEYDVSVCGRSFAAYVTNVLKEYSPEYKVLVDEYLPADDAWWVNLEEQWDKDESRWGMVLDDISGQFAGYEYHTKKWCLGPEGEYYATNPATGVRHDVVFKFAGRQGKHLLVTSFDGQPTPDDLAYRITRAVDRTDVNGDGVPYVRQYGYDTSDGYSNQWMRNFTAMVRYWDTLNTRKLAREAFCHNEQFYIEVVISDEVDRRFAEAQRLAATHPWFAVTATPTTTTTDTQ